MNQTLIAIVAAEAKAAAENETDLEGRLRAAMKAVHNHWMAPGEEAEFQGAVAGVYELSNETDRERLLKEMRLLRGLSAAASGIPVDLVQLLASEMTEGFTAIGLRKLWDESKEAPDDPR